MSVHEKKALIERELVKAAQGGEIPLTYEQFGERVGIWRMRGARNLLDRIAEEWRSMEGFDITFILCSATTGYPSQIDGLPAKPPSETQKKSARQNMDKIIQRFRPGAKNPY